MKEAAELRSPTEMYYAQPLEVSANKSTQSFDLKAFRTQIHKRYKPSLVKKRLCQRSLITACELGL